MYVKLFKSDNNNRFLFKNNREFFNLISVFNYPLYNILLDQLIYLFNNLISFTFDFISDNSEYNNSKSLDYCILTKILKFEILNFIQKLNRKQYLVFSKKFKISLSTEKITISTNSLLLNDILFCINNDDKRGLINPFITSISKEVISEDSNFTVKIVIIKDETVNNWNEFMSKLDLQNLGLDIKNLSDGNINNKLIQMSDLLNLYELTYKIITNVITIPSFYESWEKFIFEDSIYNKIIKTIKIYDQIIEIGTGANEINLDLNNVFTSINSIKEHNLSFCKIMLDFIEYKNSPTLPTNRAEFSNVFVENDKTTRIALFNKFLEKFIKNTPIKAKNLRVLLDYFDILNKKRIYFWINKLGDGGEIKFFIYNYKIIIKISNHVLTQNDFDSIKLEIKDKLKTHKNAENAKLSFYPVLIKYDQNIIENKNKIFNNKSIEDLLLKINKTKNVEICFYYKSQDSTVLKDLVFAAIEHSIEDGGVDLSLKQLKLFEYYFFYTSKISFKNNSHISAKKTSQSATLSIL